MMQQIVEQLMDNIAHTTDLYERILATERDKQRAIVAADIDALAAIVAREEVLVSLAGQLEADRACLRGRFAEADRRLGPGSRLEHVIAVIDGPPHDLLAEKHQHLLALAAQIHDVNRVNFQLLRSSIDLLRGILDEVLGTSSVPGTYDPSGHHEAGPRAATCVDQIL